MSIATGAELHGLRSAAVQFHELGVDGLVAGSLRNGELDLDTIREITEAVPKARITFHRAFDQVKDHARALAELKGFPQVDHVLTDGGGGSWSERTRRNLPRSRLCLAAARLHVQ